MIYAVARSHFFIQGVLSLTFGEDASKPSKDKETMYSRRPEIEVTGVLLLCCVTIVLGHGYLG